MPLGRRHRDCPGSIRLTGHPEHLIWVRHIINGDPPLKPAEFKDFTGTLKGQAVCFRHQGPGGLDLNPIQENDVRYDLYPPWRL